MASAEATSAKAAAVTAAAHATAAAAKTSPTATAAPAAARESIAGDGRACQRERGNQGDNLMQTRILHCGIPFQSMCSSRASPDGCEGQVRQVLPAI
jgi:hypothetical protein